MAQLTKSIVGVGHQELAGDALWTFLTDGHSAPHSYPVDLVGERNALVAVIQTSENGVKCFVCRDLQDMWEVWSDFSGYVKWCLVHWAYIVPK